MAYQDSISNSGVSILKASNKKLTLPTSSSNENSDEFQWVDDFTFIQASDTQFGLIDDFNNAPKPWRWSEETRLTELAVQRVNKLIPKPKFMIVCGDLVHAFPGAVDRDAQIQEFFRIFRKLSPDIPLVCVCGNHDIGDKPTPDSIAQYNNLFGDDYFSFWVAGVKFIVLNSQFYKDPHGACEAIGKDMDKWLDEELSNCSPTGIKPKHIVIFQHIPWFLRDPNEQDDEYFNIETTLRHSMLERIYKAGVRYVFCGHYHRNAGGFYRSKSCAEQNNVPLEMVVTSAIGCQLGSDKSGMRIVHVKADRLTHEYRDLEDDSQWCK